MSRPAYEAFARASVTTPLVARAAFDAGRYAALEWTLPRLQPPRPAAAQVLRADLRTFQGCYDGAL